MTVTEMANRIVSAVSKQDHISFVGLVEECGPEASGDCTLEGKDNLILWFGVSEMFAEALKLACDRIDVALANPFVYWVDGKVPNLPVAHQERAYQKPHWMPVTFLIKRQRVGTAPRVHINSQETHLPRRTK
jgi:hypothetical protein